jgi:site-specific DNA-methyltransferase (adenine-specific)
MDTDLMFSNKTDEYATPQDLYDKLNSVFKFTLDPCATHKNHKCDKYYTIKENGLWQNWSKESVFINPPYSQTKLWAEKCNKERERTVNIALLIPSRTETRYLQDYIFPDSNIICFIKGRLKFGDEKNSAPFPSLIAIYGVTTDKQLYELYDIGYCMRGCEVI